MSKAPEDTTVMGAAFADGAGLAATVPPATADSPEGVLRWLPGLKVLQDYRSEWLRQDVVAGLVLTAVLVPVGMAYAEAAGLPPITGLYATLVPLTAYALFGPSRILVLGPDSSLAGIIAAVVLPLAAGDPGRGIALAGMLSIITGLICVAAGIFKLGFITDLLSKPVRYGYVNGIALTVIVGQLTQVVRVFHRRDRLDPRGPRLRRRSAHRPDQRDRAPDRARLPRDHHRVQAHSAEGARGA